jgi:hypothetical protein
MMNLLDKIKIETEDEVSGQLTMDCFFKIKGEIAAHCLVMFVERRE